MSTVIGVCPKGGWVQVGTRLLFLVAGARGAWIGEVDVGDMVKIGSLVYDGPVRIVSLTRLNNSVNGNPTWMVGLRAPVDGAAQFGARTQSDASISYSIDNAEFRDTDVMVSFSKAGRIVDVVRTMVVDGKRAYVR